MTSLDYICLKANTSNHEEIQSVLGYLHFAEREYEIFQVEITFGQCIFVPNCSNIECASSNYCRHLTINPIASSEKLLSSSFENVFALWWKVIEFFVANKIFDKLDHMHLLQVKSFKV